MISQDRIPKRIAAQKVAQSRTEEHSTVGVVHHVRRELQDVIQPVTAAGRDEQHQIPLLLPFELQF